MISKEEFIELIESYQEQDKRIDKLSEIFSTSWSDEIMTWGWEMFEKVIKAYFTKEGVNWIDYYLYENPEHCYYDNGEALPLETLDHLWKLVENYRK